VTERQPWEEHWFDMARLVSRRATCPRAAIGAVLVKHKRVLATGFNGAVEGAEHCPNNHEHMALQTCDRSIHAEVNCLRNSFVNPFGATMFIVGPRPICPNCADRLREQGVTDIRSREA
jgi:dCMP deaminase